MSGFIDELLIDPSNLSNDSRFHIFIVEDPSDENISCGMKSASHSIEMFGLEMDDNGMYSIFFSLFKTHKQTYKHTIT